MDGAKTESTTFPFHFFGDLWLQDPSSFLVEADRLEMMQRMALIQAFGRSRARCRSSPGLYSLLISL